MAAKPKTLVVEIPEWDVNGTKAAVTIRQLSAKQILDNVDLNKTPEGERTAIARSIIASLVDPESGALMFQNTPEDIEIILNFGFEGCIRLNKAISAFNGQTEDPKKNS